MKIIFNLASALIFLLLADRNLQAVEAVSTRSSSLRKKPQRFRCIEESLGTDTKVTSVKCFMGDYGSFEQIEDSEIYTASSTPKKIEILGLKFDREAFAVIVLAFANVAVLMLICWYKRNREQRISILLEEQRAGFYRELATYGRLVMNEYEELHELNQQLTKAKGYDALPMVKHLVDHTTPHIPRRTSSVKKGKPVVAPPPRKAPAESNIVSKIKIGL